MAFGENRSGCFYKQAFPKVEICLPNLDFHQFFCSKRPLHSKKHMKRCLCIEFQENRIVFEIITSGLTSGFLILGKTWKYYF